MLSLVKDAAWQVVENAAVAGTTDLTTDTSDMQGYDSILYIVKLGDVTAASVITLTAYSNPTDSASGGTSEKAGSAITAGTSDYDNKLILLEVHRPTQRYMYAVLVIDTQNAVVDSILAVRFNARSVPITQGSTVGQTTFGGPNA